MGAKTSKLSEIVAFPGASPPVTPKGYIPISVGMNNESKRFMVHTKALGDADFLELLCRSAEEYGFYNEGILRIPYEANAFEELMIRGSKQKIFRVRPTQ
ncbi:Auxin-responsive protein [Actinidia chinensis var. chinensis]|uniref:Auxin-responsive protein n=1 Tax=Actinidia chinensis var. chinensis TaxID=1590841 RepID=A0A2R6R0G9_ACTCC|nr:auxin-responsive protein SAUR71-like [Actinidia eriantha]PSS18135.1 Auxin-responsive protein [Actinidia chinensis var. chinensis]